MNFLSFIANSISIPTQFQLKQASTLKYPFQINGNTFFTKQSSLGGKLLNGLKLQFQQAKGINQSIQKIAYLHLSQEIAFCSGGNVISYSPQKKLFNCIIYAANVEIMRSFYQRNQNTQYLLWTQKRKNSRILNIYDFQTKIKILCQEIPNDIEIIQLIMTQVQLTKIVGFLVSTQDFKTKIYYKLLEPNEINKKSFSFFQKQEQICNIKYSSEIRSFIYSNNDEIISLKFKMNSVNKQIFVESQIIVQSQTGRIVDFQTNQQNLILVTQTDIQFYSMSPFRFSHNYELKNIYQNQPNLECVQVKYIRANQNCLILVHDDDTMVSAFSIALNNIQLISTNALKLQKMSQVIKIYLSPFNSQVTTLIRNYETQTQQSQPSLFFSKLRLKKRQSFAPSQRKYYYQISTSYMALNSIKSGSNKLSLKPQKYLNILTASWSPYFIIQTDHQIISNTWNDVFQNVRCAAIHPFGTYMLVGFKDSFKIYSVTNEGIINTYRGDNLKDCLALAYSMNGNHFAVGTSNLIVIYGSYDCIKIKTIHIGVNLIIQQLKYQKNELVCFLKSKRILVYSVQNDYKQSFSFNAKSHCSQIKNQSQINSIFYDNSLKIIIISALNKIYFINIQDYSSMGQYDFPNIACMEYCQLLNTLFLGSQNGCIYAFTWPNKPMNIIQQLPKYQFHEGKVFKIKVSSDLRQIMSISSDGSLYRCKISIYNEMKRIKLKQWLQLKNLSEQKIICNMLTDKKLCQYTYSQMNKKNQDLKQLQEEVTSNNFIYPQEREKQKINVIQNIQTKKKQMKKINEDAYGALNRSDLQIKAMSYKLQNELNMLEPTLRKNIDQLKQEFDKQLSKILKQRDQLRSIYNIKFQQYEREIQQARKKYSSQVNNINKIQNQFFKAKKGVLSQVSSQGQFKRYNVQYQLNQICEQNKIIKNKKIKQLEQEKQRLSCRNGYLTCKINDIKKNLVETKRKMEEMKYLIINTDQSNQQLKNKEVQKQKDDSSRIAQAQKNSLRAMKDLIQKGKQIDVNIKIYQKQQKIVILLQKTLQRTQLEIQKIVQDASREKIQLKANKQKYDSIKKKANNLQVQNDKFQKKKIISRNKIKNFITNIHLFMQKSIKLKQLINKLNLKSQDQSEKSNVKMHQSFDIKRSQDIVIKKFKQQQKSTNYILNQKKYFSSKFRKMNVQNQDLVKSFNELKLQNQSLLSVMKGQQFRISDIKNENGRFSSKQSGRIKFTPFQNYVKSKGKTMNMRRIKTLPNARQDQY